MKTYLDCYPCFLRQALSAARRAQATVEQQRQILLDTMDLLQALSPQATPPVMAERIHRMVRARTNTPDPYRQSKQDATAQALGLLPELRDRVRTASDPLETAVRIAIAGNIIDDGAAEQYDLQATLARVLEQPFAIDGLPQLRQALSTVDAVLYLADNAGEIPLDSLLVEHLPRGRVTVAVRGSPVINDATLDDAHAVGLAKWATLIDNGSDAPGTLLGDCSEAFRTAFARADLIIA
ncbi:MAG: DUF89 family protein, partial [Lamprocystis purpurea]|nr:DUF89 family protein [Lamprocystis purpurea]